MRAALLLAALLALHATASASDGAKTVHSSRDSLVLELSAQNVRTAPSKRGSEIVCANCAREVDGSLWLERSVELPSSALPKLSVRVLDEVSLKPAKGTRLDFDGKTLRPRGVYHGVWEIDTETLRDMLIEKIKAGEKTEIEVPCWSTAAVYNGPGKPDWGNRYIDVDISEQYVRFYGDDGSIIWESPCITGAPDGKHDTVPGVWYINN